ncbi:MAG: porin [Methylobacter sp.]|nr:porin [Methylobacter sp.]
MTKLKTAQNQSLMLLIRLIKGLAFILLGNFVQTASAQEQSALKTLTGKDINQSELLKEHDINIGGWMSMGGAYYKDNPNNHINAPTTFNDRSGEFQLNQLNFFLQKAVDLESHTWNVGGRVDVMFGTDSRFIQATGLDNKLISEQDLRFYDLAIPQAYLEVFAPIGNGVTAKIGHFYTIIGHEVVTAPNNFFYSHSYAMQYGEPFTHTGVLLSYALNDDFTLNAGSVTGWNNFDKNPSNMNFLGGLSWTNDEATSAASWSVISGDVDNAGSKNRTVSSLVVSHSFTDKLQYVFQHDFGYQQQATAALQDAYWYGINQNLFYDFTDTFSAGLRGEWFRDSNGTLLNIGSAGNYYALTAGVNWKPQGWLTFRPEVRYDWAGSNALTFNNRTQNQQLEVAMDMVIEF